MNKNRQTAMFRELEPTLAYDTLSWFAFTCPFPYLVVDERGTIVNTNPAFEMMMAGGSGEFEGKPLAGLVHASSRDQFFKVFRALISDHDPNSLHLKLCSHHGSVISACLLRHETIVRPNAGAHTFFALSSGGNGDNMKRPEVTGESAKGRLPRRVAELELHLAELNAETARLRESQERLSLALWGAQSVWWDYDFETEVVSYGPRITHILGSHYTNCSYALETAEEFLHPEDRSKSRAAFERYLNHECSMYEAQVRMRSELPEWKWVRIRGRIARRNESGHPLRMMGVIQDINEARRVSEEREALFNHSTDLLALVDREGKFKQVNPAWEQVLGWSAESLIGARAIDFTHPSNKNEGRVLLHMLSEGGVPPLFVQRVLCKDGRYRWLSCEAAPLSSFDVFFVIARDVTDSRE